MEWLLSDMNTDEKRAIRTSDVREVDAANGVLGGKAGNGTPYCGVGLGENRPITCIGQSRSESGAGRLVGKKCKE